MSNGFRLLSGNSTPNDLLRERRRDAGVIDSLLKNMKICLTLFSTTAAATEFYMQSPNGTVWKITIDNSGNLSSTAV